MILPPALLPCPFCSAPAVPAHQDGQHFIKCPACRATGPNAKTAPDAAAKWNRRPYRDAVRASAQARTKDEFDRLFNPEKAQ